MLRAGIRNPSANSGIALLSIPGEAIAAHRVFRLAYCVTAASPPNESGWPVASNT